MDCEFIDAPFDAAGMQYMCNAVFLFLFTTHLNLGPPEEAISDIYPPEFTKYYQWNRGTTEENIEQKGNEEDNDNDNGIY